MILMRVFETCFMDLPAGGLVKSYVIHSHPELSAGCTCADNQRSDLDSCGYPKSQDPHAMVVAVPRYGDGVFGFEISEQTRHFQDQYRPSYKFRGGAVFVDAPFPRFFYLRPWETRRRTRQQL